MSKRDVTYLEHHECYDYYAFIDITENDLLTIYFDARRIIYREAHKLLDINLIYSPDLNYDEVHCSHSFYLKWKNRTLNAGKYRITVRRYVRKYSRG